MRKVTPGGRNWGIKSAKTYLIFRKNIQRGVGTQTSIQNLWVGGIGEWDRVWSKYMANLGPKKLSFLFEMSRSWPPPSGCVRPALGAST